MREMARECGWELAEECRWELAGERGEEWARERGREWEWQVEKKHAIFQFPVISCTV